MRYVPNLIHSKSKVLPDYFKGDVYQPRQQNDLLTALGWIFSVCFFIGAIIMIKHPALTLVLGLLGFVLLPPGHRWIERTLRFRMTAKIKSVFCAVLLLGAVPLTNYYSQIDVQEENELKLQAEKAAHEKLLADKKDAQRKDSLSFYIQESQTLQKKHKTEDALKKLNYAMSFAVSDAELKLVSKEQTGILATKAIALVKAGNYKAALPELTNLISKDAGNSDLRYNRAICYNKTGKIQEAVTDLKAAIQFGNKDAGKLHDKINPIKKRVTGYVTRCCDGSTSNASGRGACSHHGGVCNWNEPIYEEYRKYE